MYHQQPSVQIQPVQQPRDTVGPTAAPQQQQQQQQQPQLRLVENRLTNVQIALIGSVLFFIFANPEIFSFVNKILPGIIMNYAGKVTQSGTITHSIVFGVAFFGIVYLLQRPTVEAFTEGQYKKKMYASKNVSGGMVGP